MDWSRMQVLRIAAAVALVAGSAAAASAAGPVSVTVNGSAVSLNPEPVERGGRVFVPLRGIFERLGASVVYANRTINATGNDRSISLHIGSTTATVNGANQYLDVAPFIVGASTYVPLRFVAQALGAQVNYDGANRLVAINSGAPAPGPTTSGSDLRLSGRVPESGSIVAAKKPTIQADFSRKVDPNSVKITLDGLDVTDDSTRSETGIVYAPASPLQATQHTVVITGTDRDGRSFTRQWSFTSGTQTPSNFVTVTTPTNGAAVSGTFIVRGRTLPNARIHIVAGAVAQVGGIFALGTGNYTGDTIADTQGNFSQQVSLNTVSGGAIGLTVESTDVLTKASAQQKLNLRAQ